MILDIDGYYEVNEIWWIYGRNMAYGRNRVEIGRYRRKKLKYGRYTVETWPVGRNIGELILAENVY
ncbi:hypothetical protein [Lunatibacter salilacus]|uniref:hypothetical protein n=1 Tax=Lunatibacter salilacus TaxID=2483804 RepID=UPI00131E3003|nr:hypothetical protein [Lunatibacter salilacus]